MNISELVAGKLPEIKKLLFNEEPVAEAFEDAKLVDGTIVRYEVLEVGANLSVIGEDGEVVEVPDGTHELESGVIVRTEGGVIVEVMEPEAAPEEVEEEAKEEKEDKARYRDDLIKRVDKLEEERDDHLEQIIGLMTSVSAMKVEVEYLKRENEILKLKVDALR